MYKRKLHSNFSIKISTKHLHRNTNSRPRFPPQEARRERDRGAQRETERGQIAQRAWKPARQPAKNFFENHGASLADSSRSGSTSRAREASRRLHGGPAIHLVSHAFGEARFGERPACYGSGHRDPGHLRRRSVRQGDWKRRYGGRAQGQLEDRAAEAE